MRFRSIATAIAAVLTLQVFPLQAQPDSFGWNQFRGPNGSGVAEDCRPPAVIDAEKPTWKVDVPPGHYDYPRPAASRDSPETPRS